MNTGKVIELNVVESLRKAGIFVKTSAALDHNRKLDFILRADAGSVGVQLTTRTEASAALRVKALSAKACALDVVDRFLFLSLHKGFFNTADIQRGKDLARVIEYALTQSEDRAVMVTVTPGQLIVSGL